MVHYLHSSKNCIESLNATLGGGGGQDKVSYQNDPISLNLVSDSGTNFQNPLYISASSNNSWGNNNNIGQACATTANVVANQSNTNCENNKEPKVVSGRTRHLSHTYEPECKKNSDDEHDYATTIVENVYHHHHNRTLITDKNHHHHHHHKTIVRDNHIHHNHLKNIIRDNHYHHHHREKEHKSKRFEDPKCCVKTQHLTRRFECHDSDSDSDSIDSVSSIGSFSNDDDDYYSDGDTSRFLRIERPRSHHRHRKHYSRHQSLNRHRSRRLSRNRSHHNSYRRRYSNCIETKYEEQDEPRGAYDHIIQDTGNFKNSSFGFGEYRHLSSRSRPRRHHRHRDHFNQHDYFDRSERRVHRRHHSFSDLRRKSRSITDLDEYDLRKKFQDLLKKREVHGRQPYLSTSTSFSREKPKKPCPYEAMKKAQEAAVQQGYGGGYTCYPAPMAQPVDYCCYPTPPTPPPAPCFYPQYPPQGGCNRGYHQGYY